jgi:hypothetical protein
MPTQSIEFTFLHIFILIFSFLFFFIRRHNSLSGHGSCISSVQTSLCRRRRASQSLAVPLTAIDPDKIGSSGLPNRTVQFQAGAFDSCLFCVATYLSHSYDIYLKFCFHRCVLRDEINKIRSYVFFKLTHRYFKSFLEIL